jgi:hypothetical protein
MKQTCRNCRFAQESTAENANKVDGFCHAQPPLVLMFGGGQPVSQFPPINLDTFWCGKWKGGSLFRRLFRRS